MAESVGRWTAELSDAADAARVPWGRITADLGELASVLRLVERVGKAVGVSAACQSSLMLSGCLDLGAHRFACAWRLAHVAVGLGMSPANPGRLAGGRGSLRASAGEPSLERR